jgi:nicotinamidase-related amidase
LEGTKKALLVIDLLNDFMNEDSPMAVPGIFKIIDPIKEQIEKARKEVYPIIYLCDCHEEDDSEFKLFPPHAKKGTPGANVIDELRPEGTDILVRKNSFSGFYDTVLDETLKKLSVGEVIITGIVTNICVQYTAVDAAMRGFEVDIIEEAVTGLDEKEHRYALEHMKSIFGINIV